MVGTVNLSLLKPARTSRRLENPKLQKLLLSLQDRAELKSLNPAGMAYQLSAARLALLDCIRGQKPLLTVDEQRLLDGHRRYCLEQLGVGVTNWNRATPGGAIRLSPFPEKMWGFLPPGAYAVGDEAVVSKLCLSDIVRCAYGGVVGLCRAYDGAKWHDVRVEPWRPFSDYEQEHARRSVSLASAVSDGSELVILRGLTRGEPSVVICDEQTVGPSAESAPQAVRLAVVSLVDPGCDRKTSAEGYIPRFVGEMGWVAATHRRLGKLALGEELRWSLLRNWGVTGMMLVHEVAFGQWQYLLATDDPSSFVRVRQILVSEVPQINRTNAVEVGGAPELDYPIGPTTPERFRQRVTEDGNRIRQRLKEQSAVYLVQEGTVLTAVERAILRSDGNFDIIRDAELTNLAKVIHLPGTPPGPDEGSSNDEVLDGVSPSSEGAEARDVGSTREELTRALSGVPAQEPEASERFVDSLVGLLQEHVSGIEGLPLRVQHLEKIHDALGRGTEMSREALLETLRLQLEQELGGPVRIEGQEVIRRGRTLLRLVKGGTHIVVVRRKGSRAQGFLLAPTVDGEYETARVTDFIQGRSRFMDGAIDGARYAISRDDQHDSFWALFALPSENVAELVRRVEQAWL
ncbi:MAG: hypothetical protein AAF799_00680 [Myxococcota bacterium]